MEKRKRVRIEVKGVVQGVGFRPFIYRLAIARCLTGYVRNTTDGVDIEAQGVVHDVQAFIEGIRRRHPRAARIDALEIKRIPLTRERNFTIRKSRVSKGFTQLSPDIATCSSCLREFRDEKDRRYRFPFINCTNCGPRYSIIHNTPYDRKQTSMRSFVMCRDCAEEYTDVMDRRFHAQPDCCKECGPTLKLFTRNRTLVRCRDPVMKTIALLKQGRIIAVKGLGGFHIVCDATNSKTVDRLRKLKKRPTKPFAVMVKPEDVNKIVRISGQENQIINGPAAPIILARKRNEHICEDVAPDNPYLGVMVAYTPLHYLLLDSMPFLVMTSANIQDEPIIMDDRDIVDRLGHIISHFLTHDRAIVNRCDDSVGFYLGARGFTIMRRSRGYVPAHIELPFSVKPSLAFGPFLKNTFTLAKNKEAYVSPHIGDLNNRDTLDFFKDMIEKYKRWFRIEPEVFVHDLHPDYLSTKIAKTMKGEKIGVQHHKAHIVSCLGEHGLSEKAIGIAFDGTGYGEDGNIWGGEFFIGDLKEQQRVAHLEYLPLPGGEASIEKPYRITLAYVRKLFGKELPLSPQRCRGKKRKSILPRASLQEIKAINQMIEHDHNLVYTSSMGRLFDSVAALLGLVRAITYEAEGPINLEYAARTGIVSSYPYVIESADPAIIRVKPLFEALIKDIKKGVAKDVIAAKFHNTVVSFALDVTKKMSKIYNMKKVCLSGGVFQNRYLLKLMISRFERAGFEVLFHKRLPTNDGCISYGQIIYAQHAAERS
jgi:hydrogenase maturation protein HypF